PALLADFSSKVLAIKEGETFFYSDVTGNLDDRREFGLGLYHRDTRFLSHFRMRIADRDPVLLSSSSERAYMAYVDLPHLDLDGVTRRTIAEFAPQPDRIRVVGDLVEVEFVLRLAPHQTRLISATVDPVIGEARPEPQEFDGAVHHLRRSYEDWERECTQIVT